MYHDHLETQTTKSGHDAPAWNSRLALRECAAFRISHEAVVHRPSRLNKMRGKPRRKAQACAVERKAIFRPQPAMLLQRTDARSTSEADMGPQATSINIPTASTQAEPSTRTTSFFEEYRSYAWCRSNESAIVAFCLRRQYATPVELYAAMAKASTAISIAAGGAAGMAETMVTVCTPKTLCKRGRWLIKLPSTLSSMSKPEDSCRPPKASHPWRSFTRQ